MGFSLPLHPPYLPQTPRPTQWKPEQYPQSADWINGLYTLMQGRAEVRNGPQLDANTVAEYQPRDQYFGGGDVVWMNPHHDPNSGMRRAFGLSNPHGVDQSATMMHELGHRLDVTNSVESDMQGPQAEKIRQLRQGANTSAAQQHWPYNQGTEHFAGAVGDVISALAGGPGYQRGRFPESMATDDDRVAMMRFIQQQPAFRDLISRQSRQLPDMTRVVR